MTVLEKEPRTIRLHPNDNVVVAVDTLVPGTRVEGIIAGSRIPRGHKVACAVIEKGAPVLKFGQVIGRASARIEPGDWVHQHNLEMAELRHEAGDSGAGQANAPLPLEQRAVFHGFKRDSGRSGTRNYIGILTSVNCSASVARFMAEAVEPVGHSRRLSPISTASSRFVHGTGCGMADKGEGFDVLQRTQWGYASNPNHRRAC